MKAFFYETAIGRMYIAEDDTGITEVGLLAETQDNAKSLQSIKTYMLQETELIKEAAKQLLEYFEGERKEFDLVLSPRGTVFQRKVWEALRAIPYGETRSYQQIAEAVGNPKASRAVGMANHNNPIMCIIPCHRVIGSNGKLVGYAGGLDIKEKLLKLEQKRERMNCYE